MLGGRANEEQLFAKAFEVTHQNLASLWRLEFGRQATEPMTIGTD